jgi:hypothetical protein
LVKGWPHSEDKMKQERRDKLNSIGFVWSVREPYRTPSILDKRWNDNFERLAQYKQEHGDCLVPCQNYKVDPSLGRRVHGQRTLYANNELRGSFTWKMGQHTAQRSWQT